MMKKLLLLLLALSLSLTLLTACQNNDQPPVDTEEEDTEAELTTADILGFDKQNYGKEFNILLNDAAAVTKRDFFVDEGASDVVSVATNDRNLACEEYLGISINYTLEPGAWNSGMADKLYTLVSTDACDYDMVSMSLNGGIIGGCLGIVIMCYFKKISWRKLFDMAAPGVMLAQAMGRWGNFFNGEAYGYAIEDTTRFFFFNKELILTSGEGTIFNTFRMGLQNWSGEVTYYHPTFLYESVWNILGFVVANLIYKHKRFHGQIALFYFTWYGFGRMFIEGLRTDSLYVPGTIIRISQLVGFLCFVVCGGALLALTILTRKRERLLVLEDAAYEAAKKVEAEITENEEETQETPEVQPVEEQTEQEERQTEESQEEEIKEEPQEEEPQTEENGNGNEN